MAQNYAAGAPQGDRGPFLGALAVAPLKAIATTTRDATGTPAVSSILVLTDNTTAIEVSASGGPAYIRWMAQSLVDSSVAGTSVLATGAANYDHIIPAATVRRFVVPISTDTNKTVGASATSVVGQNVEYGLFKNVGMIGTGAITSIISITQYGKSNSY